MSKDSGTESKGEGDLHFSEEHINLLLEISKVYKIMGLLQPENEEVGGSRRDSTVSLSQQSSQKPGQDQLFPKLRWECLQHRLQTLDRVAQTKNPGVINELSNVCSQLFDLQYKSLATLIRNKLPVNETNIKQLNFFGAKFLKYTQQMLQEFFPSNLKLVQEAIDSGTVIDPVSG